MDKNCAVFKASNIIGKRWTILILLELYKGEGKWKRYNHIKSKLLGITPKMFSSRLKELEKAGIISKRVDASVMPVKSEYSLTQHGEAFIDVIKHLKSWSLKYKDNKSCKSKDCKMCDL
ncbi:MAG: winged helix-turn-helix transcriptional regulator [Candidatus Woesearchaeota archaeon]